MTDQRPDISLLAVFDAIHAERSVSRAARRLGLAQSSVSGSLGRLRALFGDPLFVRTDGEMRPTARAEAIAPRVRTALGLLGEVLADEAAFEPARAVRRFTIGATDYVASVLLPRLLPRLAVQAPTIDLRVVPYDKSSVAGDLGRGLIDLAIGVFPDAPDRTVLSPLMTERFIGIARHGHPLVAPGGTMDLAGFAAAGHVLVTVRQDATGAVDAALAAAGLARRVALTLPFTTAVPECVAASDLIAAIPARYAAGLERRVQTFALPVQVPDWTLAMLWLADLRPDQGLAWLRAELKRAAERMG